MSKNSKNASVAAMAMIGALYATPALADATPDCNVGTGTASTECGIDSNAAGSESTSVGNTAVASGEDSVALGVQAQATGLRSSAVGTEAVASGSGSQAFGWQARSTGNFTLGVGYQSLASGQNATAIGPFAQATGMGASAFGNGAVATQPGTVALGVRAAANAANGTALGALATASAVGSTAIGARSTAAFDGSTAIGAGATTTAVNQVALGGTGSSVRVGDIVASTSAQVGTVSVATVDSNGTLGQDTTLIPAVAALQTASAAFAGQLSALEAAGLSLGSRVDELFDLRQSDRKDTRQGIAAAVAMGQAPMPSAPGRTSYVMNGATFRGEQAVGASVLHRLDTTDPLAVGFGFSFAGNKNNAFKVGIAGEF